jgi:hypothetical protein
MKKFVTTIAVLMFVSTQIYSQQLFAEAEFGLFMPQEEDYNFNNSSRYGANLGVTLQNDVQVYAGYKLWSSNSSEVEDFIRFNTLVLGGRKYLALPITKIGLRLGVEYIMSDTYEEISSETDSSMTLMEMEGKGSGLSFEGGLVYKIDETVSVFVGVNRLFNDIVIENITINGVKYTRQELAMSEGEATFDMSGLNFKVSVSYSLAGLFE